MPCVEIGNAYIIYKKRQLKKKVKYILIIFPLIILF